MEYLTSVAHSHAVHERYNPQWSPEENETRFCKCARANRYGHKHEWYVTVKVTLDEGAGFV